MIAGPFLVSSKKLTFLSLRNVVRPIRYCIFWWLYQCRFLSINI